MEFPCNSDATREMVTAGVETAARAAALVDLVFMLASMLGWSSRPKRERSERRKSIVAASEIPAKLSMTENAKCNVECKTEIQSQPREFWK